MSSTGSHTIRPADDRSTKARIRDSAIACFATEGIADTTARKVAAKAGVSAGSVIHHFESMEGLRRACDEHIVALIGEQKRDAMQSGPNFDLLAALRNATDPYLMEYLARILVEDGRAVTQLVDGLVADAEEYLADGVTSGMLQPTADPRSRAVMLTLWSLGSLVMHRHLARLLDVDLTDPDFALGPQLARYLVPVMEIYGNGLFTEEFLVNTKAVLSDLASTPPLARDTAPTKGTT